MKRVTIRDVANLAEVTPAVVSRVLNGDKDLVIQASTRERILKAVRQTGYKANPMASGLRRRKTGLIGLIICDFTNPFYGKLIRSVQNAVEKKNYTCLINETMEDQAKTKKIVDIYAEKQVEGIIYCGAMENDPIIDYMDSLGIAYILATRDTLNRRAPYIGFDNEKGMRLAIDHLVSLGHRRIAHITGYMNSAPARERIRGYEAGLKEHGIAVNDEYIMYGEWSAGQTEKNLHALMSLREPPSAIVTCNDIVAIAAMSTIYEMGYRVPEDISLIGFNNIQEASTTNPPLTTVDSPMEALGKEVAEAIMERIENKDTQDRHEVLIETRLIVRDSTVACSHI